jgi:dihydrofolate reductase
MKLILLVAYGQNMVIGNKGGLPGWKLPADMENFKRITIEKRGMIMGRKTYESFRRPSGELKPLPNRDSFIVTRNESYKPEGQNERVFVCNSLTNAIGDAFALGYNEICVIGGGEIYREAFGTNFEIEILATEIDGEFEGDTFFPIIDYFLWNKEVLMDVKKDEKNSHNFKIVRYTKK